MITAPNIGDRSPRLGCRAFVAGLLLMLALPSARAALRVTLTPLPPNSMLDLPALGALDWVHWGLASPTDLNRRTTPSPAIPNFTVLGGAPVEATNGLTVACSWTNGVPTLAASNVTSAVLTRGLSNGFQLAL